jgi:D-glycero-D-manno-heptose 1,7-bisphosphate phosphatase
VRAAVFVDRDGVLNALVPDPVSGEPESPLHPEQVALLPGAAAAIRRLREAGYAVVGVSNQPAAAKGLIDMRLLEGVQARVLELLALEGANLDDFHLCFHHPQGVIPELTCACGCRKPAPGMLLEAAEELELDLATSWMLGDTDSDVAAGKAAGCRTVLIEHPASAHKRNGGADPDARAPDLAAAADLVIGDSR